MVTAKRRIDVDLLRVTAALFVVMYHFGTFNFVYGRWANAYIGSVLSCCVPIFFFVSGVLQSRKSLGCKTAIRKASKLLVLTLVWGAFLWMTVSIQRRTQISLNLLAAGVLTFKLEYTNILWFLPALAIVYTLAPLFCAIRDNNYGLFRYMVFGVCAMVFGIDFLQRVGYIAGLYLDTDIFNKMIYFLNQFNPLRGIHGFSLAYYLLGMVVGRRDSCPPQPVCYIVKHFSVCVIAPIMLAIYKVVSDKLTGGSYDAVWNGYSCVTTLLLTVSLYRLFGVLQDRLRNHDGVKTVIAFLGVNSFAVYLLHMTVRPLIKAAVQLIRPYCLAAAAAIALAIATVVVCSVVGALLRRTKLGRWLLTV